MAVPNPSQPSLPDLYDVLGVDFNATTEQVRRAYFHKARQVHPDKESDRNIDDWHLLNKAYNTLTDRVQRQTYNENLASADTESGVPDLTRLTLPSSERLSKEFQSRFENWVRVRRIAGAGGFTKAFNTELAKMLEERCQQLVTKEEKKRFVSGHKRKIISECNFERMMKSVAEAVKMPTSSPTVQVVTEHLLRIIRAARTNGTIANTTGNNVPILDLSSTPIGDLRLLLHLFTDADDTHPSANLSKDGIQRCLMEYIPLTVVQKDLLKREVGLKCGKCVRTISKAKYTCVSCGRRFCKQCPIQSMVAPCIGVSAPEPICQECTTSLAQRDAEGWVTKAQQFVRSGAVGSLRAAMACVLMAVHSTNVLPLQHLRGVARELIECGFPEQAFVILSILQDDSESNDNIKVYLSAAKALQAMAKKPGKAWKEKWVLVLMAQHASLLAAQSVALSDTSIDIPDLSGKRTEIISSICDMEQEKGKEYDMMVKSSLRNLEKAWESRDLSEMLNIATTTMMLKEDALIYSNGLEPAVKALNTFLDARKGYISRMMPDDQCALRFFQGLANVFNGATQEGLDCIEKAIWSGHHNKWISEASIPIVILELMNHPSVKKEIVSVCRTVIQNGSSSTRVGFAGLLPALGITQEDLNPSLKSCWPDLSVQGIYQGATRKYEKMVYQQVQEGKLSYCDAGYALIDFVPGACHPAEVMVCFLNASLWFLKELRAKTSGSSQQVYALKMLTLSCVQHAYVIAHHALHPGMQLYMARFALAITAETLVAADKCATADDTEFVVELIHTIIHKGRFSPFWKMPIVPVSEAVLLNILTGRLHTEFMLKLQEHPNNSLLRDAEVKYQLYENDLRWTCPVEDKDATRARAMEALLAGKGLTWSDITESMHSPLNPRSPDGWLLQQEHLGGNLGFVELRGFELDTDSDSPSIKLTAVPTRPGKCGLFSTEDVHTVLQIPSDELFPIFFSLDPPSDTQRFHPFQELRFQPSCLERTDLLYTLLQTDYLMKCFSVGSDVSANPPFLQRDCSEGLTANLPSHLKKVLAPVSARGSSKSKTSRFWIQADEIEYKITQTGSHIHCQLGEVKMVIRTQPQLPGLDGKLRDTTDEDPNSPESKFARDLTENYDEISKYFPMFGRLRELCKLQSFGVILGSILESMQRKANGEDFAIPPQVLRDIQSRARRENESRVQEMLREIREKIGEWPAAENSAMLSSMVQTIREHVRSQYGYQSIHGYESEIYEAAKSALREKDRNIVDQLTKQFTETLSGRHYRGNMRQCVQSWLSYGSTDLHQLILSTIPIPSERDIKQLFIAENKKRFNAFKSLVSNISAHGIHVPRRTCTWVPAALKVEESDDGDSMRMCYGGVLLAPKLKERTSIPRGKDEVCYDLSRLYPSGHGTSSVHHVRFNAPSGLATPKNKSSDDSSVPCDFLPHSKPIRLQCETLIAMELSIQAVHTNLIPRLANVLATVSKGAQGRGGATGGKERGNNKGKGRGVGAEGSGDGHSKGGSEGGDGGDGGDGGGNFFRRVFLIVCAIFGRFTEEYERQREIFEKGKRDNIQAASLLDQERSKALAPNTDVFRDENQQKKFKMNARKRGVDITNKHAAHRVGLDVVRHILIYVDGKKLTEDDVALTKHFCNQSVNFELVPAQVNQSDHKKKDNALKAAITEYLQQGRVSESTWERLDLTRIREAVAIVKSDDCPVALSQRVQVLRQITNPKNPAQNLFES